MIPSDRFKEINDKDVFTFRSRDDVMVSMYVDLGMQLPFHSTHVYMSNVQFHDTLKK